MYNLYVLKYNLLLIILLVSCLKVSSQNSQAASLIIIETIKTEGNKITKENIIKRELTFETGDTISLNKLHRAVEKSKDNLLNTSLFNFVEINTVVHENKHASIIISLEERWYIWSYPIFEHADRNFSNFIKDRDWDRINYGGFLTAYNLRGRNELLKIKARYGYKEQYAITYLIPYLDNKKKHGITFFMAKNRQKQIAYNNDKNKPLYVSNNAEYLFQSNTILLRYILRNRLYLKHYLGFSYNTVLISDTVAALNNNYFENKHLSCKYLELTYSLVYDNRNLAYYPTKGTYWRIDISKKGINSRQDVNIFNIFSEISAYVKLNKRIFFASKTSGVKTVGESNAYYFDNALGFDQTLRGYEYYVIYGQHYFIFKNSLKYNIIPTKIKSIKAMPFSKFNKIHYSVYFDMFFDSGYVWDNKYFSLNNYMSNKYLFSGGVGLNFVTYYDKVLTLEFSINKFGEAGIFINFEAPI